MPIGRSRHKGIVHETKVVYHYLDYTNIGSDIPMTQEGQYNMVLQVGFEGIRMGINKECPLSRWRTNLRENLSFIAPDRSGPDEVRRIRLDGCQVHRSVATLARYFFLHEHGLIPANVYLAALDYYSMNTVDAHVVRGEDRNCDSNVDMFSLRP